MRHYSPLRYPGGKSTLVDYMRAIVIDNRLLDGHYVEPYAGGAGIALELVMTDYVRYVHLNDLDSAVYAFWTSVLNQTDELLKLVNETPLSIDEWQRQKRIFHQPGHNDELSLGFAALYLNRTNRSGILRGGSVIGGRAQTGKWKLDARFNRRALSNRIEMIARYRHRIHVSNLDAEEFLAVLSVPDNTLVYLDPPYFRNGQRLYRDHYTADDHARVARIVTERLRHRWIVSYDDCEEVGAFYRGFRQLRYELGYSAHKQRRGGELMLFSNNLRLPIIRDPATFRLNRGWYTGIGA